MESQDLISIQQICVHYDIPSSFIGSLGEYELIEIITVEETPCIPTKRIKDIEKMMRLHFELDINLEGLDVVFRLLNQVESMQAEIFELKSRLKFYEEG